MQTNIVQRLKLSTFPYFTFIIAAIIRILLFILGGHEYMVDSVLYSNPLNSYKRLLEGIWLLSNNKSPYLGDNYHGSPIIISIAYSIHSLISKILTFIGHDPILYTNFIWNILMIILYICFDLFIAYKLRLIATMTLALRTTYESKLSPSFTTPPKLITAIKQPIALGADGITPLEDKWQPNLPFQTIISVLDDKSLQLNLPSLLPFLYLFSPFTIAACLSFSTTILTNTAIILGLYYSLVASISLSTFYFVLAAYFSLYPILLIIPSYFIISQVKEVSTRSSSPQPFPLPLPLSTLLWTSLWSLFFLSTSTLLSSSWLWLSKVYGTILFVPDLSPNPGLFWYFFQELFTHFRPFFLFIFQFHTLVYVLPLTIRFHHKPILLFTLLFAILSIFGSYPSYADTNLLLTLLPLHYRLLPFTRYSPLVLLTSSISLVLSPIMYHLWIVKGSANPNFFYGTSLSFSLAQVWLLIDLVYSAIKYEEAQLRCLIDEHECKEK